MNYSRQRELVYNALKSTTKHPTADWLYDNLKAENPGLSLATVYRNLNQMVDAHMIKRFCVPNSPDRYDAVLSAHYHFVCDRCSSLYDLDAQVEEHENLNNISTSHKILGCRIIFNGICEDCSYGEKPN